MNRSFLRAFRGELGACGFRRSLIKSGYTYADFRAEGMPLRTADLVAFGNRPMDYHTACIAVSHAPSEEMDRALALGDYWALGALHVFLVMAETVEWWMMLSDGQAEHRLSVPLSKLGAVFSKHRSELTPSRVLRDKSPMARQLDFVDAGLLPALEHEVGEKLHLLIEGLVLDAIEAHEARRGRRPPFPELFRLIFRTLAGKILKDKGELTGLDFALPDQVLTQVADYYGGCAFALPALDDPDVAQLVCQRVADSIRFHNLAPESLAHVYENTLVTKETRECYGTHSTPRYIADYIIWRLPIDDIPVEERYVVDPGVGCASLLTAAMRRLRLDTDPSWSSLREHRYLVRRLHGFDIDEFALETATLSLTLADFPNHDGWSLPKADLWTTDALERAARKASILVANPPFQNFTAEERNSLRSVGAEPREANKATELLRRALPHLAQGALLGVVLPRETLEGSRSQRVREEALRHCQVLEVCLLPDRMFTHSEAESGILLARKGPPRGVVFFRHVDEGGRGVFRQRYAASAEDKVPQTYFDSRPNRALRVPMLRRLWERLEDTCAKLGDIAAVGQGLSYKRSEELPAGATTVSQRYFVGAVRGYSKARDSLSCFGLTSPVWMNLDSSVVQVERIGTEVGRPQVLLNYGRGGRGPWRMRAAVDCRGFAVTSSFFAVRPSGGVPSLECIAAIINGPVANAYLYSVRGERNNSYPLVKSIPVPLLDSAADEQISAAVREFQATMAPRKPFEPRPSSREVSIFLARIDALVLELYSLPKEHRRQLMMLFEQRRRPGLEYPYTLSEELLEEAMARAPRRKDPRSEWTPFAGMWANDPTWDDFLAEMDLLRNGGKT